MLEVLRVDDNTTETHSDFPVLARQMYKRPMPSMFGGQGVVDIQQGTICKIRSDHAIKQLTPHQHLGG
jgi:hypothetical protein